MSDENSPETRTQIPDPVPDTPTQPIDNTKHESLEEENQSLRNEITRLVQLLDEKSENSISDQLWLWVKDCKMRRTAYWKQFYRYQRYNNILSTPLTLIASATGVTSIAQLGYENTTMQIAVAVLGTLSTALTAYQRYFNWGQKAVQCREIAKRYTLLARKGEMQANLHATKRITLQGLVEFMEEFRKELDTIQLETEDMPNELLNKKFTADPSLSSEDLRIAAMMDSDDEEHPPKRVNTREIMFSKAINI